MKNIISCSRRTDIPAFHYDWLQNVLKKEEVILANSYSNMEYSISLSPSEVQSIVLWSKNYINIINNPMLLSKYNLYFQFTINGYSKLLEPNVISCDEAISQISILSQKYSPKQIMWRFDPIMFSDQESSDRLERFEYLCNGISKYGVKKCTISFITLYAKVINRFKTKGIIVKDISDNEKDEFANRMVEISNKYGIQIYCCCDSILEHVNGIQKAHCVDGELLQELFGDKTSKSKDKSQRLSCGCSASKDIGDYKLKCKHNCQYCYANPLN